MQSLDREIQPLIGLFPGNKATDQNKLDSCEEYENLNQIVAKTSLIRLVFGADCMSKTAINVDVSTSQKLEVQYLNNQASNYPGSYFCFAHFFLHLSVFKIDLLQIWPSLNHMSKTLVNPYGKSAVFI